MSDSLQEIIEGAASYSKRITEMRAGKGKAYVFEPRNGELTTATIYDGYWRVAARNVLNGRQSFLLKLSDNNLPSGSFSIVGDIEKAKEFCGSLGLALTEKKADEISPYQNGLLRRIESVFTKPKRQVITVGKYSIVKSC